jgi:L-cysteine S-thiosulfotransferase
MVTLDRTHARDLQSTTNLAQAPAQCKPTKRKRTMREPLPRWILILVLAMPMLVQAETPPAPVVIGDSMPNALGGLVGDVARGRSVVRDRQTGNCLICHAAPEPEELFMGNLGPALQGVGSRLTTGQLRLRMVDQRRINPMTIMPPYFATTGLNRVAERYREQPALSAQAIEDVVAYLVTLKE